MEMIGLVVHKLSVFTPFGRHPHPDRQLRQESRALILRHGASCPVPALQDGASEGDTMTRTDSPEGQQLLDNRSGMPHRLLQLRDAGLPTQFALALFRYAIAGGATFLARTGGIPPRAQRDLDHITTRTTCALLHADDITETTHQRIFIPTRLKGLDGVPLLANSVGGHNRPPTNLANSSQGWARCWGIFEITHKDINTETLHTMALKVNRRTLSQGSMESAYEHILQSLAGDCRATAQFLSCGGPGAGAFTIPRRIPRAEMDDKTFIVTVRLRIGISMGDHVTHCHKIYHALICQLQGLTVHRHHCSHFEGMRTAQRCPDRAVGARSIRRLRAPQMDIIAYGPLGHRPH